MGKKVRTIGGEAGKWISTQREDGVSSLCKLTAHPGQRDYASASFLVLLSLFLFLLLSSPSLFRSFSLFRGQLARLLTTMARVKNSITLPPFPHSLFSPRFRRPSTFARFHPSSSTDLRKISNRFRNSHPHWILIPRLTVFRRDRQ